MSEFIKELISISKEDKDLALAFIEENITKISPEELLTELLKYKNEINNDVFCYALLRLSLFIDVFSDDALRIIQAAQDACKGYLERIVNVLRFNLVSKRKSYVSFELWECVGPRISLFLHNLANNKIDIDVLAKEIPPNDLKYLENMSEEIAKITNENKIAILASLMLIWILSQRIWDEKFKREWRSFVLNIIGQASPNAFLVLIITTFYLLDIRTILEEIVMEVIKKCNYLHMLYNAIIICSFLEMNNFSSFSFFVSNLSSMLDFRSHELIELISILSNKNVSEIVKFVAPKLFRLVSKRFEKMTHHEAEQLLTELFALAKCSPNEFLKELLMFFRESPIINETLIKFFLRIVEFCTDERIIGLAFREIIIKSKVTDLLRIAYGEKDAFKRIISKSNITLLLEISRILRQLYISLPSEVKQRVAEEYNIIKEDKIFSFKEDVIRRALINFLEKL